MSDESKSWAFLVLGLAIALAVQWSRLDARRPKHNLHHCADTPILHEIWIRHADASIELLGTAPLSLNNPLILAPGDRLLTGHCARDLAVSEVGP